MKTFLAAICLLLALGAPAAAWPVGTETDGPDDNSGLPNYWNTHDQARDALGQIAARLHRGNPDYMVLAQHLRFVIDGKGFSSLSAGEQHYAWLLYGGALFASGQFETARPALQHASEMPEAGRADWDLRRRNSLALRDDADAALAAAHLAQPMPASSAAN